MKLTYQVGIAALIHLGIITVFNVLNGVQTSVSQCTGGGSDCLGNIITSIMYFMVVTVWFTGLWLLAATAQNTRSRKLTAALIAAEFLVVCVALFNFQGTSNILAQTTSLVDAALAAWVGLLGVRLFIHGGGRVTSSGRARRRRLAKD